MTQIHRHIRQHSNNTKNNMSNNATSSSSSIYDCLNRDTIAASETLSAMMENEQTHYQRCDYLYPSSSSSSPQHIMTPPTTTQGDRLKIVDWCYSVVDACHFDRETVVMAMEITDRFLSKPCTDARLALHDRNHFQLVAIGALYIAIKTNEQLVMSR